MSTQPEKPNDFEISNPPPDGISDIAWSPQAEYLAGASWDNNVRIWEVQPNGSSVGKAMYPHDGPVLSCVWSKDGTKVASGGCDKSAKLYDLNTGQAVQVAAHDAPIRHVRWADETSTVLATGSWDKTVKYWDLRSPTPVAQVSLPERVYAMDVIFPLLVVGTAGTPGTPSKRPLLVYNLKSPAQPYKQIESPLKFQTRTVSCFPNGTGFAVGSIEGRVAIQYVEDKDAGSNFSFKCHRQGNDVYPINSISFHPIHGTFATCGGDGHFNFWDKDSKQRLKQYAPATAGSGPTAAQTSIPISCSAFNRNGNIFAYAVSYDWSRGHEYNKPPFNAKNSIYLHASKKEDVEPRAKAAKGFK
ncbi:WD40-repeat-containing domain protein [Paraphysoderma sedebokerense]|nr:WD40-repeat-containing domain protein [Paraphysoderma sedebokerense]